MKKTFSYAVLAPGLIFFGSLFLEGLIYIGAGNVRFKIDWASLIVRRKFTVFSLFYFAIWGKFPSTRPRGGGGGGLILGGTI